MQKKFLVMLRDTLKLWYSLTIETQRDHRFKHICKHTSLMYTVYLHYGVILISLYRVDLLYNKLNFWKPLFRVKVKFQYFKWEKKPPDITELIERIFCHLNKNNLATYLLSFQSFLLYSSLSLPFYVSLFFLHLLLHISLPPFFSSSFSLSFPGSLLYRHYPKTTGNIVTMINYVKQHISFVFHLKNRWNEWRKVHMKSNTNMTQNGMKKAKV